MFKDYLDMGINVKLLLYFILKIWQIKKINFNKSELMLTMEEGNKLEMYVELFNCQIGN
jgi:hypothetical protein